MRYDGYVARMRGIINADKMLISKAGDEDIIWGRKCRRKNNIKRDLNGNVAVGIRGCTESWHSIKKWINS
jgi:hypothetical protein